MRTLQSELKAFVDSRLEEIRKSGNLKQADIEVIEAAQKLQDVLDTIDRQRSLFGTFECYRMKKELLSMIEYFRSSIPDPTSPMGAAGEAQ